MADTFLPILVDDDTGTPTAPNYDGTPLDSVFFDDLSAILNEFITRSSKIVGGLWTWESFGQHAMTAGGVGPHELLVRNTQTGSTSRGQVTVQASGAGVLQLQMFATDFSPNLSGSITAAGGRLVHTGAGVLSVETVAATGISFFPAGARRATIDFANGAVAENEFGWALRNTAGIINGISMTASNNIVIGSDDASGVGTTTIGGGTSIIFNVTSGQRAILDNTNPELLLGNTAIGTFQTLQVGSGSGTPVSGQVLFGTDNTGWQLRFGKNQAGVVTHLWKLTDAGHLSPVANNSYDVGTLTERVRDAYATNVNVTGLVYPNADNAGGLGGPSNRFAVLYAVDANFGDVSFDNSWSITEGERVGLGPGLAFLDKRQELRGFIDDEGNLFVNKVRDLSELVVKYQKLNKEQRLRGY